MAIHRLGLFPIQKEIVGTTFHSFVLGHDLDLERGNLGLNRAIFPPDDRVTRLRDEIITNYVAKKLDLAYFWAKKPTLVTLLPDLLLILNLGKTFLMQTCRHFLANFGSKKMDIKIKVRHKFRQMATFYKENAHLTENVTFEI